VHCLFSEYCLSLYSFQHNFATTNTIDVLSKYNIIVGSKNALLTNATKSDISVVSHISGMVLCCHFRLSFFWLRMGWKMLASKKLIFSISIKPENGKLYPYNSFSENGFKVTCEIITEQ